MFHKEYPFKGKNQIQCCTNMKEKEEKKSKFLKPTGDESLDELIEKMLTFEEKNRINWIQYFEHEFFKKDFSSWQFNLNCCNHPNSNFEYYCTNCKKNICPNCMKECK